MRLIELKQLFTKPKFNVLTFFVTSRCNARCSTCFYWQRLNQGADDLTIDEIKKFASTIPAFEHLLLSGGEPFLRDDLIEIVDTFVQTDKIRTLDIPTNGLLTDRTIDFAKSILEKHPHLYLTIGVSFDGLAEYHNQLRGVNDAFQKAMECLKALVNLKKEMKNLDVIVLTVVSDQNVNEIIRLVEFIEKNIAVDRIMFEPVRGNPKDSSIKSPSYDDIKKIHKLAIDVNKRLLKPNINSHLRAIQLSFYRVLYSIQRKVIKSDMLKIPCLGGTTVGVIDSNGDVRLCELLEPIGNLREADYDFMKLWNSEPAIKQRKFIKDKKCVCTHCVTLGNSLQYHFPTELKRLMLELYYEIKSKISQ